MRSEIFIFLTRNYRRRVTPDEFGGSVKRQNGGASSRLFFMLESAPCRVEPYTPAARNARQRRSMRRIPVRTQ